MAAIFRIKKPPIHSFHCFWEGNSLPMDGNPDGATGQPASFARLNDYVMRDFRGVLTYIAYVLVHTCDHEAQLKLLEQCLLQLRKYNLKLNVAKSVFGASSVNYLGYTLTGEGIAPGKEKLLAVKEFPPPVSVKQIREFVGLSNHFRFLIPKFAYYSTILTNPGTRVANCPLLPCQLLSF